MSSTYSTHSGKEKWLQNVNSEIQGENTYWNKDNIKLDIKLECEGADWIQLVQDTIDWTAFISSVINKEGFVE
jgi:hypothetical protein